VAHSGAAGPAHRYVAGLGELEQAGVAGVPAHVQVAAREPDQGAAARLASGRVRPAGGRGRDAGGLRGTGAEDLGADAGRLDAARGQGGGDIRHERGRPAQVGIGIAGQVQGGQDRRRQASGRVIVGALEVIRARAAVADVPVRAGQRGQQGAGFGGERLIGAAAGAVQPPDVPAGPGRGQRVQHGQHRCRADTRADQQDRRLARAQGEGAARRGYLQLVTRPHPGVQVLAGGAVFLPLDADPVVAGARGSRQGVAAQQRALGRVRAQAQGQELSRQGGGHVLASGIGQVQRDHRLALRADSGHGERPEPGPRRWRARFGQARVAGQRPGLVEHLLERGFPPGAERRDAQRAQHLLAGMPGQVQQGVHLRDRHAFRAGGELDNRLPGLHRALGQHAEIEPGPVPGHQQRGQLRIVHPDTDPEAGDPRLGDLEDRVADLVPVADAHLVVGQSLHGEVLPELPVLEVVPAQLLLPVLVGLDLVDEHRPLLAAVPGQITLPVTIDIEPPHHPRPGDRLLPHGRVHRPAVPGHVLRHPHVDRQQSAGPLARSHHQLTFSPERRPVVHSGDDVNMTTDRDARTRAQLEQHWKASDLGDSDTENAIYATDAILDYPQSAERYRGRSKIRAQRDGHPAERHFRILRIRGGGDLWVSECVITYDGVPTYSVSVMEFAGDLVTHETQYFADPFKAPAWRAELSEQIPDRDR
jgi:hypothetical protein